jgi:hypothetical protein
MDPWCHRGATAATALSTAACLLLVVVSAAAVSVYEALSY